MAQNRHTCTFRTSRKYFEVKTVSAFKPTCLEIFDGKSQTVPMNYNFCTIYQHNEQFYKYN